MASNNDWLDGYTLSELLGAAPVTKSPKQLKQDKKAEKKAAGKRGLMSTVFGAPFRVVAGLVKLPITIAEAPASNWTLAEIIEPTEQQIENLNSWIPASK